MSIIYVAGPYTKGDVAQNVRKAMDVGMQLNDRGHYAIIPHLLHFLHVIHPRSYHYWTELDNRIIPHCNELVRIEGSSTGADAEVELAESLNIPWRTWF